MTVSVYVASGYCIVKYDILFVIVNYIIIENKIHIHIQSYFNAVQFYRVGLKNSTYVVWFTFLTGFNYYEDVGF